MNEYRTLSFFTETPCEDFYSYFSLQDLIDKAVLNKEVVLRCRTIGVLQSIHGKFFLSDVLNTSNAFRVRNSMKNIAERHQIHPSTT
ncbi:uncharacterized protein LOC106132926 isoform X2 [Amyelois transitella]|uniref:uncharacterized protein LOC106132926 isoform X2 n=1 Tax=Amyelois transitella TaxID=680683 RepID=UPI00298F5007|nr:uncharacterized protein LOC106132926 isoform X2 [Amyelois transitella]